MEQYKISFQTLEQIQDFVTWAEQNDNQMDISSGSIHVDAKSLMALVSMGLDRELTLVVYGELSAGDKKALKKTGINYKDTKIKEDWVYDAVFYHIYPLGFVDAPRWNEGSKTEGNRILKVLEWIPHLKELGINAVYFGPVFESLSHGYDTSNYYKTEGLAQNRSSSRYSMNCMKMESVSYWTAYSTMWGADSGRSMTYSTIWRNPSIKTGL